MNNLAIRESETTLHDIIMIAEASTISQAQRPSIVRMLLYAHDNGFPLSLALTGGLYIANDVTGRVEVESKPLKHRIANDPNYHIKVVESTADRCTLEMWRKATDIWPFHLYDDTAINGDWLLIGETTFTMDDANRIEMYAGGTKRPLSKKDTYQNFPQLMLHYRCVKLLISLYGDGIFSNPPLIPGELPGSQMNIIDGEFARAETMETLQQKYGQNRVLEAMQATGGSSIQAIGEWLEENQ